MQEQPIKPTEAELEVLQILWENGPSSVRYVNDTLGQDKKVGYTTTLKIMQIMNEKGLTTRDTSSRSHIYKAAVSEILAKDNLLSKFVQATFGGSASKLVLQLLDHNETTPTEIEAIKRIIDRYDEN